MLVQKVNTGVTGRALQSESVLFIANLGFFEGPSLVRLFPCSLIYPGYAYPRANPTKETSQLPLVNKYKLIPHIFQTCPLTYELARACAECWK